MQNNLTDIGKQFIKISIKTEENMNISELRVAIVEATIQEFNEKGLKFTMDDIAKRLSMSKKTIYTVFKDKNALANYMIDYIFDHIKESEREVFRDESLSTTQKLKKALLILPDKYKNINLSYVGGLREKYPKIYSKIADKLEGDWEPTLKLLEKGMEEGTIRKINPIIFKAMVESTLEHFFSSNILSENKIVYEDALNEVLDILMSGILVEP